MQRQVDLCESEANLVYRASSRRGPQAAEKPFLKKKEKKKRNVKYEEQK